MIEAKAKALAEQGVKEGDHVTARSPAGGQQVTGTVFMKDGEPWVRLQGKDTFPVRGKNGRSVERKSVLWTKGWAKAVAAEPESAALATAAQGRTQALLGASAGQVVRVAGQGRDLQAGSRFRIAEVKANGDVRLEPTAGGLGFTLNRRELSREVKAGASFAVEAGDTAAIGPTAGQSDQAPTGPPPPKGLAVRMGGQVYPVSSLEEAQAKHAEFREAADAGSRELPAVDLLKDGEKVGDFSYNSRAWRTDADGKRVPLTAADVAERVETDSAGAEPAPTQTEDRRQAAAERARVDALPADERDSEIARLRARVEELEQGAKVNPLTGLPNKQAFDADEALGWKGVAAIDMDGLKRLNKLIGHEGADVVLKALGDELGRIASDTLRVYHRSGDEFAARFKDPAAGAKALTTLQQDLDGLVLRLGGRWKTAPARSTVYRASASLSAWEPPMKPQTPPPPAAKPNASPPDSANPPVKTVPAAGLGSLPPFKEGTKLTVTVGNRPPVTVTVNRAKR